MNRWVVSSKVLTQTYSMNLLNVICSSIRLFIQMGRQRNDGPT